MGLVQRAFPPACAAAARVSATACVGSQSPSISPVALASIGFGAFVALLSLPLFAYALIVNRVRIFESSAISLEALEPPGLLQVTACK